MEKTPKEIIQSLVNIGYTQEEIAQKSDLTQATISRLLSGSHRTSRLDTYKRLLKIQEMDSGDKSDNAAIVVGSTYATRGQNTENSGDAGGGIA